MFLLFSSLTLNLILILFLFLFSLLFLFSFLVFSSSCFFLCSSSSCSSSYYYYFYFPALYLKYICISIFTYLLNRHSARRNYKDKHSLSYASLYTPFTRNIRVIYIVWKATASCITCAEKTKKMLAIPQKKTTYVNAFLIKKKQKNARANIK